MVGLAAARLYPRFKQGRMLDTAHTSLAAGDYRGATLAARQVLSANPVNLDAAKIMAEVADHVHSPQSLYWRRRVAELEPGVLDNYFRWLAAAAQQGQLPSAELAVATIPENLRATALYHEMASTIAALRGDNEGAVRELNEAMRLRPDDPRLRLSIGTLQLQSSNAAARAAATDALKQLLDSPLRADALRALVGEARRARDFARALGLARDLRAMTNAPFGDQLLFLTTLREAKSADYDAELRALESLAEKNPRHVLDLATWLNTGGLTDIADAWLARLPAELRSQAPVQMARADTLYLRRDWKALAELLDRCAWDEGDFLRFAMLARAHRELGDGAASVREWNAALALAGSRAEALYTLSHHATTWGWTKENADVLWTIARGRDNPRPALVQLNRRAFADGDAAGMLRLAQRLQEIAPDDDDNRNNVANLSLLLGVNLPESAKLAEQLHAKSPTNAAFATTLALALHAQGRTADGLKVLRALPPTALNDPSLAAYFGILLAESGAMDEARRALALAEKAKLLPQEKALVESARKKAGM
ncbi:MAG: hypothetical protein HY301_13945 [Verrucomicrobia bacterium]|nr:hypothetical protein [Verrucomicrobiota bacterium]